MRVTDRQVRALLMEYQKIGEVGKAALKAGMHRESAGKYIASGELPSQRHVDRDWLTRVNPFEGHWAEVESMLSDAPELEGKALFDWLCERYPGVYQEGQVRTFQRHVRRWRALCGPDKEVYFQQEHVPGVRMETDFTCMNALAITICGEPFDHLLCHDVLTYSNWEWATICHSESLLALRSGLQAALVQLGHVPMQHWTDHSTAATHELGGDERGHRGFNVGYLKIMDHFGLEPRTINRHRSAPGLPFAGGAWTAHRRTALEVFRSRHVRLRLPRSTSGRAIGPGRPAVPGGYPPLPRRVQRILHSGSQRVRKKRTARLRVLVERGRDEAVRIRQRVL